MVTIGRVRKRSKFALGSVANSNNAATTAAAKINESKRRKEMNRDALVEIK